MSDLPETRLRNMDARRRRILDAACQMLASGGMDGLTLRGVAERAGVTVPTIYNLLGAKEAVVAALIAEALDAQESAMAALPRQRGIARAQAAVRTSVELYFGAPERYGAVFRAMQDLQAKPDEAVLDPLFRRAGEVFCNAVREAQEDGDLHGRLLAVPLGHHILHAQIENFRLWAVCSLPEAATRARAFYSLYVSLMADATKQGRRQLLAQLRDSEAILDD
jgi:AcrR family transcriptional regulator